MNKHGTVKDGGHVTHEAMSSTAQARYDPVHSFLRPLHKGSSVPLSQSAAAFLESLAVEAEKT